MPLSIPSFSFAARMSPASPLADNTNISGGKIYHLYSQRTFTLIIFIAFPTPSNIGKTRRNQATILIRANALIRDSSHYQPTLFLALSVFSLLMTLLFLYVEQDNNSEVPDAFGSLGIMTCWYFPRSMVRADNS